MRLYDRELSLTGCFWTGATVMVGSTGSLLYHSRLLRLVHSGETKLVLTGQCFTLCDKVQLVFVSPKVLLHN